MIDSLIIELFLAEPPQKRIEFLNNIRKLCDSLEESHNLSPDTIDNLYPGDKK